jgi:hypothetical protein
MTRYAHILQWQSLSRAFDINGDIRHRREVTEAIPRVEVELDVSMKTVEDEVVAGGCAAAADERRTSIRLNAGPAGVTTAIQQNIDAQNGFDLRHRH